MRKLLSVLLAIALVMSLSVTAFAADAQITVDGAQSAETLVTYEMLEGYTVIIPDSVVINTLTSEGEAVIAAENVIIDFGKTLNIKISGDDYEDAWELIDKVNDKNKLVYNIGTSKDGDDIVNNSIVLAAPAGDYYNQKLEETLHFSLAGDTTKSGAYEDTLTFTVSID